MISSVCYECDVTPSCTSLVDATAKVVTWSVSVTEADICAVFFTHQRVSVPMHDWSKIILGQKELMEKC